MLLNNRSLNADEKQNFQKVLESNFRPDSFDMMLNHRLGWNRENITMSNGFKKRIFDVIDYAEELESTRELLNATLAERPNSLTLRDFAQKIVSFSTEEPTSSHQPVKDPLERRIRELDSQLNVVQWRMRLEKLERQICRIVIRERGRTICGTGFLIESDTVLTSYHIVKEVINGAIAYPHMTLSFDFKLNEDGQTLAKETVCHLNDDWLIDYSEFSPADLQATEHCADVDESYLDYAILRLKEKVGEELIAENIVRGWISLPEQEYTFIPDTPLFILHHPYADPLLLTFNTQAIQEINTKQTRVRYRTFTEDGSSGAPCWSINWELIAIHQSGDPDFFRSALYNQGIPIAAIARLLRKRGKMKFLVRESQCVQAPLEVLPVSFDSPEEQMPKDVQLLLTMLLEKSKFSGQLRGHSVQSILVSEEMIMDIADIIVPEQVISLLNGYIEVAHENTERAQQTFLHRGDIRLAQFTQARNALEIAQLCLQKFCALLNNVVLLSEIIPPDSPITLCLKATKIIENNIQLCLDIKTMQEKYSNDRARRKNIYEKCGELLEWLKELKK